MGVLSIAKLARGREDYYLSTLAAGREGDDGLVEPDGRWLGRAAATLGLSGTVEATALKALLAGVDPATGELLAEHRARVRVVAYDCTYSTPKSVSLLHALGPEEVGAEVRSGHEEAVVAALGYLERRAARVRRSAGAGRAPSSVPAAGFAAASFLHRTSRAPDPHLHSHVLVANLGRGPEGRWSALDGRGLYLELGAARDLYETQLRFELTRRLAVTWRELNGSWADLAGIDAKVVRAFSRRSVEIAAALAGSGRTGPAARRIAASKTRPEKDLGTAYEDLVSNWRERSYGLGVSDSRLAAVAGRACPAPPLDSPATGRPPPAPSVASGFPELDGLSTGDGQIAFGRWADKALGEDGVLARDGTCRRGDLVRSRCETLPAGAPVAEVERDVESLLTAGRVVTVAGPLRPPAPGLKAGSARRRIPGGVVEPVYTTPEVLGLQERMAGLARAHPGAAELLAYRPGGRLDALDALGGIQSEVSSPVVALAPGRPAAESFEAVTGIETAPVASRRGPAGGPASLPGAGGVLVLADAHRLGPWELSSALEASLESGGRLVLFAPAVSLESGRGPVAALAPHLGVFAPRRREKTNVMSRSGGGVPEGHRFGRREVLVVGDGPAAREALLQTWASERGQGRSCLIVAGDGSVLGSLREAVRKAGGSPDEVVETRRLAGFLSGNHGLGGEGSVAVLGALPARVAESQACRFVQVAVAPGHRSAEERLAIAAELARPRYLVSELGAVRSRPGERAVWREGARAIEAFRRRWSIGDGDEAVGDRRTLRDLEPAALAEASETRLKVREVMGSIDPPALLRRRRSLEAPGLWR